MHNLNVMIAVPTHDQHPAMFGYDLAQLMAFTVANLMGGEDAPIGALNLAYCSGTYVHTARQELAEIALKYDTDFVLWLDSDMRFPKDALARLLMHNEDVVGINYSTRGVPPQFVAIADSANGVRLVTAPESTGLEQTEAIGFGCVLMRAAVLRRLADHHDTKEKGPWFFYRWREDTQTMVGEDVYFAELLKEVGVDIYVDHDLSKACAHIGSFEFGTDHAMTSYERAESAPEEESGSDE